jgi:hypothetical protein
MNRPAVDGEGRSARGRAAQGAKYSENRGFCLEPTGWSSKTARQIKRLDAKFVTRAEQWNFHTDQRIFAGLTIE